MSYCHLQISITDLQYDAMTIMKLILTGVFIMNWANVWYGKLQTWLQGCRFL